MTTNEDKLNAWWAAQVQAAKQENDSVTFGGDTPALFAALAKAQGDMPGVVKDAANDYFGSDYATLGEVLRCITPALNKHGLFYMQNPNTITFVDGKMRMETLITHASGGWMQMVSYSPMPSGKGNATHAHGSTISYTRRYVTKSIFAVPEMDDDGNAAGGIGKAPAPARKPAAPTNGPGCPKCGGAMWDNREDKTNPKAPDFKCKKGRDQCNGVIWPDRDAPKAEGAGAWSDAERRGFWKIMGELKIEKWMLDEFIAHTNHRRQPADFMTHPKNMTEPERVELLTWFSSAAGVQVLNEIRDDLNADFNKEEGPF